VSFKRYLIGISYQQTSHAYPSGGESYTVAKENLGQRAGLIAAAALVYATSLSRNVHAIHIEVDAKATPKLEREWDRWDIGYELEILSSPYRSIVRPLVDYVLHLQAETPGALVTVVTPELVPRHWWEYLLHNKTALYIRTAFLFKPNVVVVAVPYLVGHEYEHEERGPRWTAEASVTTGEVPAAKEPD
jgi:hypothetical protein